MGWFRPKRTVCDPSGQEWELYVSRVVPPTWSEGEGSDIGNTPPMSMPGAEFMVLTIPFALAGFLWSSIIVPFVRFCFLMPFAVVRGRRSHAARIEAMCFYPEPETRTWTTTIDQVDSVLNETAAGLEQGKVVQPAGAVYLGSHEG